jgi:hypothetical protein
MTMNRWSGRGLGALVALALLAGIVPLAPRADARTVTTVADEARWEEAPGEPGDQTERWWGVAGAALCGAEIRLILRAPAIGMNPYLLAAGIAGCTLAAIDVMSTK